MSNNFQDFSFLLQFQHRSFRRPLLLLLLLLLLFIWLLLGLCCCAGFSLAEVVRGYTWLRCTSFSLQVLLLFQSQALGLAGFRSYGAQAREPRLSRCDTQARLLPGMWDLPRPGIKPISPALAGGFFTTEPPRKPWDLFLKFTLSWSIIALQCCVGVSCTTAWTLKFSC